MTTRTAEGGCHCGRVRFKCTFKNPPQVLDCNCSMCAAVGFLHLIIPNQADFELVDGRMVLTEYRFESRKARHLFCKHCGVKSFYIPRSHPEGVSVNWRCLEAVSDITPTIKKFDGLKWEEARAKL
eukprot:gb/GEZN01020804.1/.p1 GENE.gb/GEZN01020804.1/~~gb/GEZN01020804.1/.p1  ORF type:complete len:126 (+),score=9.19 gb/GEZN01020804.1/:67-444(+)